MRDSRFILISALVAAAILSGCLPEQQGTQSSTTRKSSAASADRVAELTLPSGTSIDVTLGTPLTSETAHVGDSWTGSAHSALLLDGRNVISAGTPVSG